MNEPSTDPDLLARVTNLRRTLHQFPELGHKEWRTADLIASTLLSLGLTPFRPATTSVAVVIGPPDRKPRIGFRADIDALRIDEATNVAYRSQTPGVMHACGHDGHTAAMLGLAIALQQEKLSDPVLLVFQQAEEANPSGAPPVLGGLPSALVPSEFFGFHLWPQLSENVVGVRPGPMLAAVAGLVIKITGQSGRQHGTAFGEGGTDALAAGLHIYQQLRARLPFGRRIPAGSTSALAIGMMNAGEAPNALPVHCTLSGTLRAVSWQDETNAVETIRAIAAEIAAEASIRVEVIIQSGIRPPVCNDAQSSHRIEEACRNLGIEHRIYPDEAVGVSDDFGWYIDGRPGAMFLVGCGTNDRHPDLHDPRFDFREHILLTPIRIGLELARQVGTPGHDRAEIDTDTIL